MKLKSKFVAVLIMMTILSSLSISFAAGSSSVLEAKQFTTQERVVYGEYYHVQTYTSNSKAERVNASVMAGILSQLTGLDPIKFAEVTGSAYTALDILSPPETVYYKVVKEMKITTDGYHDLYHMRYTTIITDSNGNYLASDVKEFSSISPMVAPVELIK